MKFARLPRILLLLLLLGAVSAQQWAVQAHWHAISSSSAASVSAPAGDAGGLPEQGCLWCQVASHAGAAAPPAVQWSGVCTDHLFVRLTAESVLDVPASPAHAWHSRGPPRA
jgi:hypothetical protein